MTCPVCGSGVWADGRNIGRHRDKAGNVCPASGQPAYITEEIIRWVR